MLNFCRMKNISGYSTELLLLVVLLLLMRPAAGQDTLRTYGPRLGVDLARFAYLFADPAQTGAEISLDAELYPNLYPVMEAGYNRISEPGDLFDYTSAGTYARLGADYNILPMDDRSVHHTITGGVRYGVSFFSHRAEKIRIPGDYWGDYILDSYSNSLTGHWLELVVAARTEVAPNFFLGWSVRYKILLTPHMDDRVTPRLVPGYGRGSIEREFGFTYHIMYKIPVMKQ